jgi:hypothetical protein
MAMLPKPVRWTAHDPVRCQADELPEGAPCRCPAFWPRPAAYWRGVTAVGAKQVDALLTQFREARQKGEA